MVACVLEAASVDISQPLIASNKKVDWKFLNDVPKGVRKDVPKALELMKRIHPTLDVDSMQASFDHLFTVEDSVPLTEDESNSFRRLLHRIQSVRASSTPVTETETAEIQDAVSTMATEAENQMN